jgi:hypothetical protein
MTKEERNEAQLQGKTILRPMYKNGYWYVAWYTKSGGWKTPNGACWRTKEECAETIDYMVELSPTTIHDK